MSSRKKKTRQQENFCSDLTEYIEITPRPIIMIGIVKLLQPYLNMSIRLEIYSLKKYFGYNPSQFQKSGGLLLERIEFIPSMDK